ncbi:MAG: 2-amino-4-hydroxy-6-hydroxymethyldihydropteridine diphosphokinase [Neisseria sp.]|nr:2-amino-4-hydroxy-6-hydroxymethyldihydropteridine diphosphokinase [Neisseria sp.]
MKQAIIALGSNLENPIQQVQNALNALANLPQTKLLQHSSLYLTTPIGYAEQADFVNAVCEVQTALSAKELLQHLQNIENQFGRVRSFRNAPRTLDLDVIDFNHEISDDPDLILPHPRAFERGFVMCPLAEILPDFILGEHGKASDLAAKTQMQGVQILANSADKNQQN